MFEPYKPIGMPKKWGKEVDYNLRQKSGATAPSPATELQHESGQDEHSIVADALFSDPSSGDFRVKEGSPALALGFKNFPMDEFGVQKPSLKAIARTPSFAAGKEAVIKRDATRAPGLCEGQKHRRAGRDVRLRHARAKPACWCSAPRRGIPTSARMT